MNKLPLIALVVIVAGVIGFSVYNKKHVCDSNCQEHQQQMPVPVTPPVPGPIPEIVRPIIDKNKTYTYTEGLALAKQTNAQVLVVFGAEWCHWCKKLEADTLSKPEFRNSLNNMIVVHVDTDKEKAPMLKFRAHVHGGIPAYIVIDKDEKVLKSGTGYKNISQFNAWLAGKIMTNEKVP